VDQIIKVRLVGGCFWWLMTLVKREIWPAISAVWTTGDVNVGGAAPRSAPGMEEPDDREAPGSLPRFLPNLLGSSLYSWPFYP
jgi:hypothetical protein